MAKSLVSCFFDSRCSWYKSIKKFNTENAPFNDDGVELCHLKLSPLQHIVQVLHNHNQKHGMY